MTNVVKRPTLEGGKGFCITGHNEIMFPLLAAGLIEALERIDLRSPCHLMIHASLSALGVVAGGAGTVVEAELDRPMASITHIGFCTDSAIAELSPLKTRPGRLE